MISRDHLKGVIKQYLREVFQNIDDQNIDVDFWKGTVELSNSELKQQSITLKPGLSLSLLRGSIDSVRANVSWSVLGIQGLSCSADGCHLKFVLGLEEPSTLSAYAVDSEAIRKVSFDELRMLGESKLGGNEKSWISKLISDYLTKLARNLKLTFTNLTVDVAFPETTRGQHTSYSSSDVALDVMRFHVRLNVPCIEISPRDQAIADTKTPDCVTLFAYDILIRELTLSSFVVPLEIMLEDSDSEEEPDVTVRPDLRSPSLRKHVLNSLPRQNVSGNRSTEPKVILCPCYVEINICKTHQSSIRDNVITVRGHVSNLEFLSTFSQIDSIKDIYCKLQSHSSRLERFSNQIKLWKIAAMYLKHIISVHGRIMPVSHSCWNSFSSFSAREKWRFLIRTVVRVTKMKNKGFNMKDSREYLTERTSVLYTSLYRYLISKNIKTYSSIRRKSFEVPCETEKSSRNEHNFEGISETLIISEVRGMERLLTPEELLIARIRVHLSLIRDYTELNDLRNAARIVADVASVHPMKKSFFDGLQGAINATVLNIQDSSTVEFSELAGLLSEPKVSTTFQTGFEINRTSFTLLKEHQKSTDIKQAFDFDEVTPKIIVVGFYGIFFNHSEESLALKVGSIRVYDSTGEAVVLCGTDPDEWLSGSHISKFNELELSFNLTSDSRRSLLTTGQDEPLDKGRILNDDRFESFETEDRNFAFDRLSAALATLTDTISRGLLTFGSNFHQIDNFENSTRSQIDNFESRRTTIEVRVALLTILWDLDIYSTFSKVFGVQTCQDKYIAGSETASTKSCSISNITTPQEVTRSTEVICAGIAFRFILAENISVNNKSQSSALPVLNVRIGRLSLWSGDFLDRVTTTFDLPAQTNLVTSNLFESSLASLCSEIPEFSGRNEPSWFKGIFKSESKRRSTDNFRTFENKTNDAIEHNREDYHHVPQYEWVDVEGSVKDCARNRRIKCFSPVVVSIPQIELSIATTMDLRNLKDDRVRSRMTERPWNVACVISNFNTESYSCFVDLFTSELSISTSFEDIHSVSDALNEFVESTKSTRETVLTAKEIHGLQLTTQPCQQLFIDDLSQSLTASIKSFSFNLVSKTPLNEKPLIVNTILCDFSRSVLQSSRNCRSILVSQKLCIQRLIGEGMFAKDAELLSANFALLAITVLQESILSRYIDKFVALAVNACYTKGRIDQFTPIFAINIDKIQLSYELFKDMTYHFGIGVGDICATDEENTPLLHISRSPYASKLGDCSSRTTEDSFFDGILELNQFQRRYRPSKIQFDLFENNSYQYSKPLPNDFFASSKLHKSGLQSNIVENSEALANEKHWLPRRKRLQSNRPRNCAYTCYASKDSTGTTVVILEVAQVDITVYSSNQISMIDNLAQFLLEIQSHWCNVEIDSYTNEDSESVYNFDDLFTTNNGLSPPGTSPVSPIKSVLYLEDSFKEANIKVSRKLASNISSEPVSNSLNMKSIAITVDIAKANMTVGSEKKFLSSFCLCSTRLSYVSELGSTIHQSEPVASCVVGRIAVYDLSSYGRIHDRLLWSRTATESPVLVVDYSAHGVVSIRLQGTRFLLLRRFVEELGTVLIEHIWVPLFKTLSAGTMADLPESYVHSTMQQREKEWHRTQNYSYDNQEIGSRYSNNGSDDESGNSSSSNSSSTIFEKFTKIASRRSIRGDPGKMKLSVDDRKMSPLPGSLRNKPQLRAQKLSSRPGSFTEIAKEVKKQYTITIVDIVIYLPRNSLSSDLVAFSVTSTEILSSIVSKTWTPPDAIPDFDKNKCLYFDSIANTWNYCNRFQNNHIMPEGNFNRFGLTLKEMSIFVSLKGASNSGSAITYNQLDDLGKNIFPAEVKNHDFTYLRRKRKSDRAVPSQSQTWRRITENAFNLAVIVDSNNDITRTLFCDTSEMSTIHLSLSMAELYLLEGLWFDNMSERILFFDRDEFNKDLSLNLTIRNRQCLPEYGSSDYFEQLRSSSRPHTWSTLFVRADISIRCFIDYNYFPTDPKSLILLTKVPETEAEFRIFGASNDYGYGPLAALSSSMPNAGYTVYSSSLKQYADMKTLDRVALPAFELKLAGIIIHGCGDTDCTSIGVTSSLFEIIDIRKPSQCHVPYNVAIRVGQNRLDCTKDDNQADSQSHLLKYFPADMDFGLNMSPSSCESPTTAPLQISFLHSSVSNWSTTHIGMTTPDICISNANLFHIIIEYFGAYFWTSEFGNPIVAELEHIQSDISLPYSGIDLRIFLHKLHLLGLVTPFDIESQALVIETDRGMYYRFSKDSESNTTTQLDLYDLAIVLMKHCIPPKYARGQRGSAGSGRGVRTILEHLNGFYSHNFYANHEEILISVPADRREQNNCKNDSISAQNNRDTGKYNNINNQRFAHLAPKHIYLPTCVIPIAPYQPFYASQSTCHIVVSYEDVEFCIKLLPILFLPSSRVEANNNRQPKLIETESSKSSLVVADISNIKFVLVDNLLGLHLPLIQLIVPLVTTTVDCCGANALENTQEDAHSKRAELLTRYRRPHETEVRFHGFINTWGYYFNSVKKCWEPLLEELKATCLYEMSQHRGTGFILKLGSTFHVNFSSALAKCIEDISKSFQKLVNSSSTTDADQVIDISSPAFCPEKQAESPLNASEHNSSFAEPRNLASSRDNSWVNVELMPNSGYSINYSEPQKSQVLHLRCLALHEDVRVGFSILNLTGQCLRFLQTMDDGKKSFMYLCQGERGTLNFLASSTSIRNKQIVEEAFDIQLDRKDERDFTRKKQVVGHHVAVQISGFNWIPDIQADELGIKYFDIDAVIGKFHAIKMLRKKFFSAGAQNLPYAKESLGAELANVCNALKLVSEVIPHNGGRLILLRSSFTVTNRTSHRIHMLATYDNEFSFLPNLAEVFDTPFTIESGASFNVPLAFLHQSIVEKVANSNQSKQNGKFKMSLGALWIRPAELSIVREALDADFAHLQVEQVEFSKRSIDLAALVKVSTELLQTQVLQFRPDGTIVTMNDNLKDNELCCHMHARPVRARHGRTQSDGFVEQIGNSKLPLFCYNIDVRRVEPTLAKLFAGKENGDQELSVMMKRARKKNGQTLRDEGLPPLHYTIDIHPPIRLENLLPMEGLFELFHEKTKRSIWKSMLGPEESVCIHTVTLDDPLLLEITLRYCKTSEGILINKPKSRRRNKGSMAQQFNHVIEDIFFDDFDEDDCWVDLIDTVSQRLKLGVENIEGDGGQRSIIIYCPYWVVNTSQYTLRIREEQTSKLPAGTVFPRKNGPQPMIDFISFNRESQPPRQEISKNGSQDTISHPSMTFNYTKGCYPGLPGLLNGVQIKEIPVDSSLREYFEELPTTKLMSLAFMFNYQSTRALLGSNKVCVQIDDSDWSAPFSLDNLEINQSVSVDHSTKGAVELGLKVILAPGRIGKYTKIVRFMPRIVVVNNLDYNLKLLQPTGFAGKFAEILISKGNLRPFHFPDPNSERKLIIQVEGPYSRTVQFGIDAAGVQTLAVNRSRELSTITHVNTRGDSEYVVVLPPQVIGLYFETDWKEQNIVVKNYEKNGYASLQTDIQIGDVLIEVDGQHVSGQSFDAAMSMLKERLRDGGSGCTVKFRTVEEKMRLIRGQARRQPGVEGHTRNDYMYFASTDEQDRDTTEDMKLDFFAESKFPDQLLMRLEIQQSEASTFVYASHAKNRESEYRIDNYSVSHLVAYKQKSVPGNRWRLLGPGQSSAYHFDNPFVSPHKLVVRVLFDLLCPSTTDFKDGDFIGYKLMVKPINFLSGSEASSIVVDFDKIGFRGTVTVPRGEQTIHTLKVQVSSEGPTKTLCISLPGTDVNAYRQVFCAQKVLLEQKTRLEDRIQELQELIDSSASSNEGETEKRVAMAKDRLVKSMQRAWHAAVVRANNLQLATKSSAASSNLVVNRNTLAELALDPLSINHEHDETGVQIAPFESVLGDYDIPSTHKLLVQVIEAKDLKPFVAGKLEDVFCKVQIKVRSVSFAKRLLTRQKYYTYICDATSEPVWLQQKFLLDTPPEAVESTRGVSLRVTVLARSVLQVSKAMGKVDVDFSCLKSEEPVVGWFPLRSPTNEGRALTQTVDVIGSVKLKLIWIHSGSKLAKYTSLAMQHRLKQLDEVEHASDLLRSRVEPLVMQLQSQPQTKRERVATDPNTPSSAIRPSVRVVRGIGSSVSSVMQSVGRRRPRSNTFTTRPRLVSTVEEEQGPDECLDQDSILDPTINPVMICRPSDDYYLVRGPEGDSFCSTGSGVPCQVDCGPESDLVENLAGRGSDIRLLAEEESVISPLARSDSGVNLELQMPVEINLQTALADSVQLTYDSETAVPKAQRYTLHRERLRSWVESSLANIEPGTTLGDTMRHNMSNWVKRPEAMIRDHKKFLRQFVRECIRQHAHIYSTGGTLEVTPLQALHLPESTHPMLVRLSYGELSESTFAIPHATDMYWYQEDSDAAGGATVGAVSSEFDGITTVPTAPVQSDRAQLDGRATVFNNMKSVLTKRFEIDLLNSKGALRVRVMAEHMAKRVECARVHLPIFNLLECLCMPNGAADEDDSYTRWFPLMLTRDTGALVEGQHESHDEQLPAEQVEPFEYRPCIRLRLRWIPNKPATMSETEDEGYLQSVAVPSTKMFWRVSLPSVSVSVIDSDVSVEILQLYATRIDVHSHETYLNTELLAYVESFQVDNQLVNAKEPVLLHQTQTKHPQPIFRLFLRKNNLLSKEREGLACYDAFESVIQELDVHLEQQTVLAAWEFAQKTGDVWHKLLLGSGSASGIDIDARSQGLHKPLNRQQQSSSSLSIVGAGSSPLDEKDRKLYIDRFNLNSIKINISFLMSNSIGSAESIRRRRQQVKVNSGSQKVRYSGRGILFALSSFLLQVGEVVLDLSLSITDAPIRIEGMSKENFLTSQQDLTSTLQKIYFDSIVNQIYGLVGSLDLVQAVGFSFAKSLGVGVTAFFVEPGHAIINSPTDLDKIGLAAVKGTSQLVSKTVEGVSLLVFPIFRAFSRGLSKVTMDEIFLQNREELMRQPPTLGSAVARPFKDIGNGVYCSIVGLARVPARDYRAHGARGIPVGVVKGVAGIPLKLMVGIVDSITHSVDAIVHGVKLVTKTEKAPVSRWRLSCLFGPDGRVLPYNYRTALGANVMQTLYWQAGNNLVIDGGDTGNSGGKSIGLSRHIRRLSMTSEFSSRVSTVADSKPLEMHSAVTQMQEFVLHTAQLRLDGATDRLVILTTIRVVTVDYRRAANGVVLSPRWEVKFDDLAPPELDNQAGKVTLTLTHIKGRHGPGNIQAISSRLTRNHFAREDVKNVYNYSEKSFVLEVDRTDSHILVVLFNCIVTMQGGSDIRQPDRDTSEFVEDGPVTWIGSWSFDASQSQGLVTERDTRVDQQRQFVKGLQHEPWALPPELEAEVDKQKGLVVPEWLARERATATRSHGELPTSVLERLSELGELSRPGWERWPGEAESMQLLNEGLLTGTEFLAIQRAADIPEAKDFAGRRRSLPREIESQAQFSRSGFITSKVKSFTRFITDKVKPSLIRQRSDSKSTMESERQAENDRRIESYSGRKDRRRSAASEPDLRSPREFGDRDSNTNSSKNRKNDQKQERALSDLDRNNTTILTTECQHLFQSSSMQHSPNRNRPSNISSQGKSDSPRSPGRLPSWDPSQVTLDPLPTMRRKIPRAHSSRSFSNRSREEAAEPKENDRVKVRWDLNADDVEENVSVRQDNCHSRRGVSFDISLCKPEIESKELHTVAIAHTHAQTHLAPYESQQLSSSRNSVTSLFPQLDCSDSSVEKDCDSVVSSDLSGPGLDLSHQPR